MTSTLHSDSAAAAQAFVPLVPGHAELDQLRRRARAGIWIESVGLCALMLVAFAVPSFVTDRLLRLEWVYRALLLGSFVAVLVRLFRQRLWQPLSVPLDDEEMALAVERSAPGVKQALISSLQFSRELQTESRSIESLALKQALVTQVRAGLASIPFAGAIDRARVRRFGAGVLAAVLVFGGWAAIDATTLGLWAARNLALVNVDWPRYTTLRLLDADGAALRLPQGDALTVRVLVDGAVPDQAFVDYRFASGERGAEPMSRTGEREFTWTIDAVLADMQLSVQAGDSLPLPLTVTIVERPQIGDLAVQVMFPDYMEREPFEVPTTEGDLRLPKGARLRLSGTSQKPLAEAFVLFGDQKTPLGRAADERSFVGEFAPTVSGLLVVDVIDRDRLGAGAPPKLLLRVGDDKPPTLELRLRGIGSSLTFDARIPGDLKVKDDFGLRSVRAAWRVVDDKPPEKGQAPPPEVPFAEAKVLFGEPLVRSALRYETTAIVDLEQWQKVDNENDPTNPIRPGLLLSLRYAATDNFDPGEPHEGFGETMTFRIVTRERMIEELRRRQVEQRQELLRLIEEEQRLVLELQETVNPTAAGDRRRAAEARLKALSRQQQALGRRVAFVGESYQRILWEYENNRLIEPNKVRQIETLIPQPLQSLAKEAFPTTARRIDAFVGDTDEATRNGALEGCREILRRLGAVLKEMEQAESLAALIEDLKAVINLEKDAIRDVEGRVKDREQDIFGPKKK